MFAIQPEYLYTNPKAIIVVYTGYIVYRYS